MSNNGGIIVLIPSVTARKFHTFGVKSLSPPPWVILQKTGKAARIRRVTAPSATHSLEVISPPPDPKDNDKDLTREKANIESNGTTSPNHRETCRKQL